MKFKPAVALILGAVLAAIEAVQLQIMGISVPVHDTLTFVVMVFSGLGVLVASPSQIAVFVPHQVLVVITAVLGAANMLLPSLHLPSSIATVAAVVLVVANTWFSTSGPAPSPSPAPTPPAKDPPDQPATTPA